MVRSLLIHEKRERQKMLYRIAEYRRQSVQSWRALTASHSWSSVAPDSGLEANRRFRG
jgi:hypothetical protein